MTPDWRLKLDWAQTQTDIFTKGIEGFLDSDSNSVIATEPYPSGKQDMWECEMVLTILKQPPINDWRLMIGDIIHSYRTALDILVYQTAPNHKGRTAFPIYERESDFRVESPRLLDGLSDKQRAFIEREQPYNRWKDNPPSDPLLILRKLDNTSKHRVIPAVVAWVGATQYDIEIADISMPVITFSPMQQSSIGSATIAHFSFRVLGDSPKVDVKFGKRVVVVFDKGADGVVGREAIDVIRDIKGRVLTLVSNFESEIAIKD